MTEVDADASPDEARNMSEYPQLCSPSAYQAATYSLTSLGALSPTLARARSDCLNRFSSNSTAGSVVKRRTDAVPVPHRRPPGVKWTQEEFQCSRCRSGVRLKPPSAMLAGLKGSWTSCWLSSTFARTGMVNFFSSTTRHWTHCWNNVFPRNAVRSENTSPAADKTTRR